MNHGKYRDPLRRGAWPLTPEDWLSSWPNDRGAALQPA